MPVPTHHAHTLKSCFRNVFGCRGREFGSLSRGVLGVSDGNEGVQWNAGYYPRDGAVWLGVNLDGYEVRRLAGRATHRARDLPSAPPDPVSPEGRKAR